MGASTDVFKHHLLLSLSTPPAPAFGGMPSRFASTICSAGRVSRSSRITKLRVTPSASAISAADRYLASDQVHDVTVGRVVRTGVSPCRRRRPAATSRRSHGAQMRHSPAAGRTAADGTPDLVREGGRDASADSDRGYRSIDPATAWACSGGAQTRAASGVQLAQMQEKARRRGDGEGARRPSQATDDGRDERQGHGGRGGEREGAAPVHAGCAGRPWRPLDAEHATIPGK